MNFPQQPLDDLRIDTAWRENYSGASMNRKFSGILPTGIYSGFQVTPDTGMQVKVSSNRENTAIVECNGFSLKATMPATKSRSLTLAANKNYIIALKVHYQIGENSVVELLALDSLPNDGAIKLADVKVPAGSTEITQDMITCVRKSPLSDLIRYEETNNAATDSEIDQKSDELKHIKLPQLWRALTNILSNNFNGDRTDIAVTEKALKDGLATKWNYTTAKINRWGTTLLSNNFQGTSQHRAMTEKGVKDGLEWLQYKLELLIGGKSDAEHLHDDRYLKKSDKALDAEALDGINSVGFSRAYSANMATGQGDWTTKQFVDFLVSKGCFNSPHWIMKCSWSYAHNKRITDLGNLGIIHLAGCVIEVIGSQSHYMIRVLTPTTSSGGGATNAQFIYVNHGSGYGPGWRRDFNTRRPPTSDEVGALGKNETSKNTERVNGKLPSVNVTPDTLVQRDAEGDINARYFTPSAPDSSSMQGALAFRTNPDSDNHLRFCSESAPIRDWLGVLGEQDADIRYLQGCHNETKSFTVGGDANTYYPVRIVGSGYFGFHPYSITRHFSASAPDTWHKPTHKGGLTLTFLWSGDSAWGGNHKAFRVEEFHELYSKMVAGMQLSVEGMIVWLRGGGASYRISSPKGRYTTINVHLSGFTARNGSKFPPRTNLNNVENEIHSRWPVRGTTRLYDGKERAYSPNNLEKTLADICPVGIAFPWPLDVAPKGFAIMKGQQYDKSRYPLTAKAYPSGILDDMRGLGVIGKKDGEHVLAYEADQVKSHGHPNSRVTSTNVGRKWTNTTGNHTHSSSYLLGNKGDGSGNAAYGTFGNLWTQSRTTSSSGSHNHYVDIGSHAHGIEIAEFGAAENTIKNRKFNWITRLA
ncbi:hypothetical protein [Vibrio nigripulchritudo]|nr:hypothetical protein [Vibrio nigripulchritudo]